MRQALCRPWERENQPSHHSLWTVGSLACYVPTLRRAWWGAGYGAPCHLHRGVCLGHPVIVVAEMPVFVFTSLLLECSHLQGMYSQAQEGTFTELLVYARTTGDTQRPMSQRHCRSGGGEAWEQIYPKAAVHVPSQRLPRGPRGWAGGIKEGRLGPPVYQDQGRPGLLWDQRDRGSLGPLGKGPLRALVNCSPTAWIKGTLWLFECVLTFHSLGME